jgi:hypothetical protein
MIEYTVRVYALGTRHWYLNGKRHREDGPACEHADGTKEWYLHGKLHREDGPAIEFADGTKFWHLNGEQLTEEEHAEQTAPAIEMTVDQICKALGKKVKVVSSEWQTIKSQYQDFKKDEGES